MTGEVLLAGAFSIAAALGVVLVRQRVPLAKLMEHHEVAGVCFAVVGGLYGIILAFVLVSSWERYELARAQTEFEASAAGDLFRHSEAMSEPARSRLGAALIAYVQSVIDDEWPAMFVGHPSTVTQERYQEVWQAIIDVHPKEAWEVALYQATLGKLDDLSDGRRNRIYYIKSGLPRIIWNFLLLFGVATVAFTYFFGMPRLIPQILITVVLAATIAWTLVLVRETQTPFSGGVRVSDRAFRLALKRMHDHSVESPGAR